MTPRPIGGGVAPPALSVVVPAFNEAARIGRTVARLLAYFDREHPLPVEILVCDDGSRDATPVLVRAAGDPRVRLLRVEENRGKGAAVGRGVLAAVAPRILMTDADLSTPIAEYPALAAELGPATPVVIGSRYLSAGGVVQPRGRRLTGMAFSGLARLVLGLTHRDSQCGFKLFTRDTGRFLFGRAAIAGFAFDAEVLYIARLHGIRVVEVPVRWTHDEASKIRVSREAGPMLRDLLRIRASRGIYLGGEGRPGA